jgi:hypothetical protein
MMSDQIAARTGKGVAGPSMWRRPVALRHATPISALLHRIACGIGRWARIPCLPYAALWEASFIGGLVHERDTYSPDPFATEMPFLADSWPRR